MDANKRESPLQNISVLLALISGFKNDPDFSSPELSSFQFRCFGVTNLRAIITTIITPSCSKLLPIGKSQTHRIENLHATNASVFVDPLSEL